MEAFADVAVLSRIQFALTVAYHFLFVPLSIGLGLILAINETRYYRSRKPEDAAATKFWVKVFTATFAIGVATGITMEFSFGTNWANYSRFVGDIFGAPLAAEALFAFFLESVFLGVLLFGRERVSPKFYMVSSWLVWAGSCLSALWILIANSWMQTPAGAELNADGTEAVITDFFSAAFNPSIFARYTHTVDALLIMGAFVAMAVAGWYMLKGRNAEFAMKTMRIAAVVGIVTSCAMIVFAHSSAVVVWNEQPTKLAMMEGMYDSEVPPLYAVGIVDEDNQEVIAPFAIPGGTSFLATGNFETEYPGLNELAQTEEYGDMVVEDMHARGARVPKLPPHGGHVRAHHADEHSRARVHLQGGRIARCAGAVGGGAFAHLAVHRHSDGLDHRRGGAPALGGVPVGHRPRRRVAADGRRHLHVGHRRRSFVADAGACSCSYLVLLIGWARVIGRFIKEGPVAEGAAAADAAAVVVVAADAEGDVVVAKAVAAAGDSGKEGE